VSRGASCRGRSYGNLLDAHGAVANVPMQLVGTDPVAQSSKTTHIRDGATAILADFHTK
jgi:hypothetical protein